MRSFFKAAFCLLLAFGFVASDQANLYAMSAKQRGLYNKGVYYYDEEVCQPGEKSGSEGDAKLASGENRKAAFLFFVDKGWKDYQAAGIVGNLVVESAGVEPQRQQGIYDRKVPADKFPDPAGATGWGIAQWTPGSKMINPVKDSGKDPNDLLVQLNVIHDGLEGKGPLAEKQAGDQLKTTKDYKQATEAFQGSVNGSPYFGYERPASRTATIAERTGAAKIVLKEFGSLAGTSASTASASSESSVNGCACVAPGGESADGGGKVVVLDPGHSEKTVNETDPETGIKTSDGNNGKENKDMWEASEKTKGILEKKGYKVISTKKSESDSAGLIERANIANDAKADIAVSFHSTAGKFGTANDHWGVTPQEVGRYRTGTKSKKTFTNQELADKSLEYAKAIQQERKKTEGDISIAPLDASFRDSGRTPSVGDISIVQLFSNVPWIYNEVGQSGIDIDKYADGVANGIMKALGGAGAGGGSASSESVCGGVTSSDFSGTIKSYAHPDYHSAPYLKRMPAWAEVADNPKSHYVGGTVGGVKGIDCGGFVTMTIRNSGIDPDYNPSKGNTVTGQLPYLKEKWEKLNVKSTADLQPGDVAINAQHTFLFVGKIDGFNDVFASASYSESGNGRAPMAGQGDAMIPGKYEWYRKK